MRIVEELLEEDLVRFSENTGHSTGGRPPSLLEFKGEAYAVIAVDLGGTQMLGTVADLAGNVLHEIYVSPEKDQGPEGYVETLSQMIETLLDSPRPLEQEIRGIGIGAPGVTLTPEGVVTWAPSLGWRDLGLQELLNARFDVPVFVENDVNLAALGEFGFGAGRGVESLVSIVVGSGIGAGIIIGGALYRGFNQAAGEICYMVPDVKFLGRRYDEFGTLESLASFIGIVKRTRQQMIKQKIPIPETLKIEDIFAAARAEDPVAQQVMQETIDYLAIAIANISATLDPEVIILSGNVALSADLFIDPILERIEGAIPFVPKVVASSLGHRGVIMGAIMLVLNLTSEHFTIKRLP
jgi:glucokinase-like ROK family protein